MQAASPVFQWLSEELERATPLTRLEARGTLRLALRRAGLSAEMVGRIEMLLVLKDLLPVQLDLRGVADSEKLCRSLAMRLEATSLSEVEAVEEAPEKIFERMFGDPAGGVHKKRSGTPEKRPGAPAEAPARRFRARRYR